ncbi:uncharacterized protein LOC125750619 isoform X2 [Brienomyrus brachyistius]|uniref:uncharacterized protein LOC125750619 isoform X2 n=1 Tax=Brienomyrus brachyistius TaxID=42636 RepID=UPI0020B45B5C|nr:uncharacterized protein LOC125750619 isoform X2 [Brienomyrus brachyistius]
MNWVGGSRDRCLVKSDVRKQREFFQRRKMERRTKHAGQPAAPQGAGSLDLVTMLVVNQIATKKEHHCEPKITYFKNVKAPKNPIELPMSPCSPSALCLEGNSPQQRAQCLGLRRRTRHTSQAKNHGRLSPVWESGFSDSSVPDYQHGVTDTLSLFSACKPESLSEKFGIQPGPEFVPFSQPRMVEEQSPWIKSSSWSQQTPSSPECRVQFGNVEPCSRSCSEESGAVRQKVSGHFGFTLEKEEDHNQLSDLGFHQTAEFEEEETRLNSAEIQSFSKPQNRCFDYSFWSQVSENTRQLAGRNRLNSCGTPSCSSRDGFLSTDTDDEDDSWWHQSSPSQSSVCVETPTALRLTAHLHGGDDHKDGGGQNQICATDSRCEQLSQLRVGARPRKSTSEGLLVLTQHSRKHPIETKEAGTQTDSSRGPCKSDVSIQCSLGQEHGTYNPNRSEADRLPVNPEVTISASRGHPTQAEQNLQSVWNSDSRTEHLRSGIGQHSSLSRGTECLCKSEELPEPPSSRIHVIRTAEESNPEQHEGAEISQSSVGISHHLPWESAGGSSTAESKQVGEGCRAFWESEETATLHEIADILVKMKHNDTSR